MGSDHIRAVALVEGTAASHVGFGRVGFGLSARWGMGSGHGVGFGLWARWEFAKGFAFGFGGRWGLGLGCGVAVHMRRRSDNFEECLGFGRGGVWLRWALRLPLRFEVDT